MDYGSQKRRDLVLDKQSFKKVIDVIFWKMPDKNITNDIILACASELNTTLVSEGIRASTFTISFPTYDREWNIYLNANGKGNYLFPDSILVLIKEPNNHLEVFPSIDKMYEAYGIQLHKETLF